MSVYLDQVKNSINIVKKTVENSDPKAWIGRNVSTLQSNLQNHLLISALAVTILSIVALTYFKLASICNENKELKLKIAGKDVDITILKANNEQLQSDNVQLKLNNFTLLNNLKDWNKEAEEQFNILNTKNKNLKQQLKDLQGAQPQLNARNIENTKTEEITTQPEAPKPTPTLDPEPTQAEFSHMTTWFF